MNTRKEIAEKIVEKLQREKNTLQKSFLDKENTIGFFYIDDLLPDEVVLEIHRQFPEVQDAIQKKNLREFKYVAYQMNAFQPLLEEVIYAFQNPEVVALISEICKIPNLYPDDSLYAGGISLMRKGNFLNPHLDNSHDHNREKWRVLNLLYYVTPDWTDENGGNLELWQHGLEQQPTTILSKFNRLVVMATHERSWHSVNKVTVDATRCCVSNYYFSDTALISSDTFHVTTFRGRPSEKIKDVILQIDSKLRNTIRKLFKKGIRENPHQYKK